MLRVLDIRLKNSGLGFRVQCFGLSVRGSGCNGAGAFEQELIEACSDGVTGFPKI